jgi:hypothetical protein
VQEQDGEEGTLLRATKRNRGAIVDVDFERPEDPKLHVLSSKAEGNTVEPIPEPAGGSDDPFSSRQAPL